MINRVYLSAHFKYGIYKPSEVEHPIKKRVRLFHEFFLSVVQPPEVYKSCIQIGRFNKLYITCTLIQLKGRFGSTD